MEIDHEAALVGAFVAKPKRERILEVLRGARRRRELQERFPHEDRWDPRFVVPILPQLQSAESIFAELVRRGAPETAYVVSAMASLDAQSFRLMDALRRIVGVAPGTAVSCIPGRLAYFEGEGQGNRFILERPSR